MENVSKALIIAASALIAVMLFAFMMYIFGKFSIFSESTENRYEELAAQKFNSQFEPYATESTFITNTGATKDYASFGNATSESINNSDKTRFIAAKELNTISDVVTVVNLAVSTNYINNDSYQYNTIEKENSVEVIIDLSNVKDNIVSQYNIDRKYYIIEPNENVKANYVYGTNIKPNYFSKNTNIEHLLNNFGDYKKLSTYTLLEAMREAKTTIYENRTYTIYKYYFLCNYHTNEITNKIDSIQFTAIEDKGFNLVK